MGKLRQKLTYPHIVSTLALFAALGTGGAYAADKIGSKDIAKKAVKSKHIKNKGVKGKDIGADAIDSSKVAEGSLLSLDFAPGELPQGEQGPQGDTGATGPKGERGATGATGPFPEGDIPSGKTIRGTYVIAERQDSTSSLKSTSISFGFQLASAPEAHFLFEGLTPPTQCPGSATDPQAAAGHLCVYERTKQNRTMVEIFNPATASSGASRWGAGVAVLGGSTAPGDVMSYGTWAVTSP